MLSGQCDGREVPFTKDMIQLTQLAAEQKFQPHITLSPQQSPERQMPMVNTYLGTKAVPGVCSVLAGQAPSGLAQGLAGMVRFLEQVIQ